MKSEKEIKKLFEKAVSELEDCSNDDYVEGVMNALGWVLDQYDDPLEC